LGLGRAGLVLVLVLGLAMPVAFTQVEDQVAEAFKAIVEAEAAGGDVSELVEELNHALLLIRKGDEKSIEEAKQIISQIVLDAEALRAAGLRQRNVDAAVALVKVAILVGVAVLVWMRGDEWFWRLWLRPRRRHVVQ